MIDIQYVQKNRKHLFHAIVNSDTTYLKDLHHISHHDLFVFNSPMLYWAFELKNIISFCALATGLMDRSTPHDIVHDRYKMLKVAKHIIQSGSLTYIKKLLKINPMLTRLKDSHNRSLLDIAKDHKAHLRHNGYNGYVIDTVEQIIKFLKRSF